MGAIVLLFFFVVALILSIVFFKGWRKGLAEVRSGGFDSIESPGAFVGFWIAMPLAFVFILWFSCLCFTVMDAGAVGVQVMFGRVLDRPLTAGFQTKSPFVKVVRYSTRLKEYTMSIATGEGAKAGNDSIEARTKDNSQVNIDATIWWSVDPLSAFDVYRKIAQDDNSLADLVVRPASRTAIRDEAAGYDLAGLMQQRDQFSSGVYARLKTAVAGKGILIDKVLVRTIIPPKIVDDAIQAKLKAEQELAQKTFELQKTQKDAEIRITEARGIASAQEIIQQKLTPLYVQYEAIKAYERLAGSPNTTFVIMPTSPNASGMPLILGTK